MPTRIEMGFGSPAYWTVVAVLALVVAAVVLFVQSDREEVPGYWIAVAAYIFLWAVVACVPALWLLEGLPVGPLNVPLGPALSIPLTVAVLVVAVCGHVLAGVVGSWRVILHPWALKRKWTSRRRSPVLSAADLRAAEAYDAKWQIEDRERNRRLGAGPRL